MLQKIEKMNKKLGSPRIFPIFVARIVTLSKAEK